MQPILHITSTSQFSLARGLPYIWILVIVWVLLFIVQTYLSLYLFSVLVSLSPAGQLMMSLLLVGLNLVFSSIGLSSNLLLIVLIFNLKGFAETEIILSDLKFVQLLISNLDYEFFVFSVFLVIFVYPPLDGLFFSLFLHYCFLI